MMTGKQLSLALANPRVVPQIERGPRPALFALVARLLAPTDHVQRRLRQAQASLEQAVARLECSFQDE